MGVPRALCDAVAMNPREAERKQVAQLLSLWDTRLLTALGGGGPPALQRAVAGAPRTGAAELVRQPVAAAPGRLPGAAQGRAALLLHGPGRRTGAARCGTDRLRRARSASTPTRRRRRSARWRSSATPRSNATCAWSARGRAAGRPQGCWRRQASTWSCWSPATTTTTRTSTAASWRATAACTCTGAGPRRTTRASACSREAASAAAPPSTTRPRSVPPTTCARSGPRTACPPSPPRSTARSLDAVCDRLGVNQEHNAPSAREEVLQRGLTELGWHADFMPRNVRGCEQGENCGYCDYGCRYGAKQSTVKTWLADAHAAGARILVRTRAEKVVVEGGDAPPGSRRAPTTATASRCARARSWRPAERSTPPRCCAAPASQNVNIGKHLRLHPATVVWGVFDEEVRPWEGTMQAIYSDEHRFLDDGYGVKYETAAIHPSLLVRSRPGGGAREHARIMEALPNSVPIGVLLRDRDGGEVRVDRDGHPIVKYACPTTTSARAARGGGRGADPSRRRARSASSPRTRARSPTGPARRRPRAVHARRGRVWLGRGPLHVRLVSHHGQRAHGRLSGDVRLQPAR